QKREDFAAKRKILKKLIREPKTRCFLEMYDAAEQDPWRSAYRTVVKKAKQAKPIAPKEAATMTTIVDHLFPAQTYTVPSEAREPAGSRLYAGSGNRRPGNC
ncbi:hypothetical protein KR074_001041, partial [Drosophila pseudoananassae]